LLILLSEVVIEEEPQVTLFYKEILSSRSPTKKDERNMISNTSRDLSINEELRD
jgi:hypothetical protein